MCAGHGVPASSLLTGGTTMRRSGGVAFTQRHHRVAGAAAGPPVLPYPRVPEGSLMSTMDSQLAYRRRGSGRQLGTTTCFTSAM